MNLGVHLTPTQQRIVDQLSDGYRHHRDDVLRCLDDPEADFGAMATAIHRLRNVIQKVGYDVTCEVYMNKIQYRLVRTINQKNDE